MPDHGLEVVARRSGYILGVVYVEKNDTLSWRGRATFSPRTRLASSHERNLGLVGERSRDSRDWHSPLRRSSVLLTASAGPNPKEHLPGVNRPGQVQTR